MKKVNFAGIDILRFLAAMLVCLFHLAFMNTKAPQSAAFVMSGGTFDYAAIYPLTSIGWVGVQVFFVISGFVIFGSAKGTASAFARSRFLRLYPAVWVCAPISLILSLFFAAYPSSEALTRIARSVLLWPKGNWVDGVYWTLGIEIFFYFVVFMLLAINLRRAIIWFCLVLGTISSTYWLLQFGIQNHMSFPLLKHVAQLEAFGRYFELSLIPHGCYFAIGAVLYVILCEGGHRLFWLALGYFSLGACVEIQATALAQGSAAQFQMNGLLAQAVWLFSVAILILSVKMGDRLSRPLSRLHSRELGSVTYPLYLLHTTVGAALLFLLSKLGLNPWVALGLVLPSVVLISYFVHMYGEQRLKKLVTRILDLVLQEIWVWKSQVRFEQSK